MDVFFAEMIGTAVLILLGNGVVANVVLKETKGNDSGWIVICAGWGFAVFVAVACVADISGAHLNPAVTIGLAAAGKMAWSAVPGYIMAQMTGALVGASLVYLFYRPHYSVTDDPDGKLATFCTTPAIRNLPASFLCEVLATAVLVLAVLMHVGPELRAIDGLLVTDRIGLGSIGALEVGLVVFAIGLSLGGTTGYAINPARDLGPRIAHALLPIPGKRDSDWSYAGIPVVGPILGALVAVGVARLLGLGAVAADVVSLG
ncbi:MAG: MIP/aquaporin family protein [Planctomycetota bacterium]|nr:MIP/aquaporin family protein [Planctomycetota bacterium]MEE3286313.1 MIP/aquaporin family protein [Planctomycetota bacterium]MEE3364547.1 MIP/aquaporin family protein [Planctomycetota bacterium]